MYSLPILVISFLLIKVSFTQHVIRGEKTRLILLCPLPNSLWYGPKNQTILPTKYSLDHVQLTIDYLIPSDQGEYTCLNNETNQIIKKYEVKLGTMKNILPLFFILISMIVFLIPIFWYLGKRYSGIDQ